MRSLSRFNAYRVHHPIWSSLAGDDANGAFRIRVKRCEFLVIASDGGGWDHVSVSLPDRCPTWEEMSEIKRLFFGDDEWAIEYHPPTEKNISVHDYCLHLWRPQAVQLPTPPLILV